MATSYKQEQQFIKDFFSEIIPHDFLEQTVQWIQDNLEIEDVFTWAQIENWMSHNGYRQVEE